MAQAEGAARRRCDNCGASLPVGEAGAVVRCGYCATEHRVPGLDRQGIAAESPRLQAAALSEAAVMARRAPRGPRRLLWFAAVAGLGIAVFALFAVTSRVKSGMHSSTSSAEVGGDGLAAAPSGFEARLRDNDPGPNWASFDVQANSPWALGIARRWSPDAVLTGIYADYVPARGGPLELSGREHGVVYRFFSPGRYRAATLHAPSTKLPVTLELRIKNGTVGVAMMAFGSVIEEPTGAPPLRCELGMLIGRARASPRPVKKRSHYRVRLRFTAGRWQWSVTAVRTVDFDAASCAPLR